MQITNFKFHQPLKHLENRHHPLFMSGRSDESEQLTEHLLVHLLSYTISMVLILWFLEILTCILFLKMVPLASHWCFTAESKRIFTMWTSWNASLLTLQMARNVMMPLNSSNIFLSMTVKRMWTECHHSVGTSSRTIELNSQIWQRFP